MDCVVLLPGQAAVEAYRKRAALEREIHAFGTTVATPASWLSELWDLWGDARHIASPSQRLISMYTALERQTALPVTRGVAELGVRLVEGGLGTPQFDRALEGEASSCLSPSDAPLLSLVREYERILSDAHMIDAGRAWGVLASGEYPGLPVRITTMGCDIPAVFRYFCSQHHIALEEPQQEPVVTRVPEGVKVRFAFPAGQYAQPLLLVDLIVDMVKKYGTQGRIILTACQPQQVYESIAEGLSRHGISCACQDYVPFAQTDFGRAYVCVRSMLTSEVFSRAAVTDYLLNPFSGVSKSRAYDIDAHMRGNRLITADECLGLVAEASPSFEYFEQLATSPDAAVLTGWFEDRARSMRDWGEAYVAEQLSAISCLRSAAEDALKLEGSMDAYSVLLDSSTVNISRHSGDAEPQVIVMGQRQAAQGLLTSCSALIMCDMTSAQYPLRIRDDAVTSLLKSLDLAPSSTPLEDARRTFCALESLPTDELVIERCLNDADAQPTYPAAVVDEFVDCYRDEPTKTDEIDNRYALPQCFLESIVERGEETLYENASLSHGEQAISSSLPYPSLAQISSQQSSCIVLPRVISGKSVLRDPCFSASQLESYLECPQKWFALRRLRLEGLDEGFGPVEMGEFSHRAFERFYQRFQSEVAPKVTLEYLEQAQTMMREVVNELAEEQFSHSPSSGRLVPRSHLESRQVDELCERLVSFLEREAQMLPEFTPRYFEYDIPVSNPADYAGYKLVGSVDRIDVDKQGRAVIIDYKSSLSDEYNLRNTKKEIQEGKVQSLIYAQAIRRRLGLQVVGAIYVSYGRNPRSAGAIDVSMDSKNVPGLKEQACTYSEGPFSDLLDNTEERIAAAIERMLSGHVEPCPSNEQVCTWCPEMSCPKRQG